MECGECLQEKIFCLSAVEQRPNAHSLGAWDIKTRCFFSASMWTENPLLRRQRRSDDSTMLSPTYFVTARALLVSQRSQRIAQKREGKNSTAEKIQRNIWMYRHRSLVTHFRSAWSVNQYEFINTFSIIQTEFEFNLRYFWWPSLRRFHSCESVWWNANLRASVSLSLRACMCAIFLLFALCVRAVVLVISGLFLFFYLDGSFTVGSLSFFFFFVFLFGALSLPTGVHYCWQLNSDWNEALCTFTATHLVWRLFFFLCFVFFKGINGISHYVGFRHHATTADARQRRRTLLERANISN